MRPGSPRALLRRPLLRLFPRGLHLPLPPFGWLRRTDHCRWWPRRYRYQSRGHCFVARSYNRLHQSYHCRCHRLQVRWSTQRYSARFGSHQARRCHLHRSRRNWTGRSRSTRCRWGTCNLQLHLRNPIRRQNLDPIHPSESGRQLTHRQDYRGR